MPPIDSNLTLEAGELLLRLPAAADVDRLTELCQDPEIGRWTRVPAPYTRRDAEEFIALAEREARRGNGAHLCVCRRDGLPIGCCSVAGIDWGDLVGEVGYWVAAHARGRGVATRSTVAVCRWAFDELGLERLRLRAAVPNVASNAVARAVGFVLEGTERAAVVEWHTGERESPRVDTHLYGLLPGELAPLASAGASAERAAPSVTARLGFAPFSPREGAGVPEGEERTQ